MFNIGPESSDSVLVALGILNRQGRLDTVRVSRLRPLAPDSSAVFRAEIPTAGLRQKQTAVILLDPQNQQNELFEDNNRVAVHFFVRKDTTRPELTVQIDGKEILPGDWVARQPTIEIEVSDNSALALTDTNLITVFLDGKRQAYGVGEAALRFQPESRPAGSGAKVVFQPNLSDGSHTLDVLARDATQNLTTTHLEFRVISAFQIRNFLNFPNPTEGATDFTYALTQPAESVSLALYTLSGRKIFGQDDLPTSAGPNIFHWDGRDADGDPLANGVYLAKITARRSGKAASALGKLIILR